MITARPYRIADAAIQISFGEKLRVKPCSVHAKDPHAQTIVCLFRRMAFKAEGWRPLSTTSIQTTDQHGATMAIKPGLNVVADMGRSIDPRVFIMEDADFLSFGILDKVSASFQSLYLTNYKHRGRFPDTQTRKCTEPEDVPGVFFSCDVKSVPAGRLRSSWVKHRPPHCCDDAAHSTPTPSIFSDSPVSTWREHLNPI